MRRWLSIICFGTLSIYAYGEQRELVSSIKSVTVYADRAAISRQAEVLLPAGEHELYFKNLPVQLDNNSVQLNVLSATPATLLDVTTNQQAILNEANPRLQKIEEEIKQLNEQKNKFKDEEVLLVNQQLLIKMMQSGALGANKDGSRPSVQELKNVMQFAKENQITFFEKQRQITDSITQIDEKLRVLSHERYPIARNTQPQAKNIIVRVNLQQPSKVNVDLSYVTPNAMWYPTYDARFNTLTDQLQLDYSAVVKQMTGEDWKNIKLTLSTAKPSLGNDLPALSPWLIDQARQAPPPGATSYSMDVGQVALAPMMRRVKDEKEDVPALKQMASVDMGMTSVSFNIKNPVSLNSGAAEQRVSITEMTLPHKLNYIAVPKLVSSAYLQMSGTNNSDFPLIGGKLNIFMDSRFVTTSQLKTTMPKETLTLNLGIDEGITVNYKPIKRFAEKTGFTNGYNKITYEYLLTLQNNKKMTETIKVFDQIPVSSDESISIKQLFPDPKLIKQDKEGNIRWELTLDPQKKKELTVQFSIEYPDNMKVTGL